ncbi:formimidoylglutamate deiminase [Cohaesibacter sp. ES.047]|uniref:formimidoylglutamate deiminase n=1 Tax=Cohaesibacter sp. ES.047 TaxID=1798205 RepID=UPI000BB78220|nr:formimidoylglutamate deiminase [Cohaesibacter sp. ES.047]
MKIYAETALLPDGWKNGVLVDIDDAGRIVSTRTDADLTTLPSTPDHTVPILLPAPANLHSHAFQRAMAGMSERRGAEPLDTFWTWRQIMYRFLDILTPEDIEAIAAFVQMEMLEAGYGCNVEFHYVHHQADGTPYAALAELSHRIGAAAQESGIGLTLLPVLYQYGGCDMRPLGPGQIRFGNDFERFARLHQEATAMLPNLPVDSRIGVAPHSLRAVGQEALRDAVWLVGDGPLHMHLAEQVKEVEEVKAAWGARPTEWLLNHHQVDEKWCLIHCTQMTDEETDALAATGAVAGLCPITESSLGDGIFNGVRYLSKGGRIGIGSDSNIRISLSEELRTLEYSQRLRDHCRASVATTQQSTGRVLFEAAVAGGAQAAGRASGRIETGAWADLLALDGASLMLDGVKGDEILDMFLFAADDRLVTDVWSAGRHLVKNGMHIRGEAIRDTYRQVMRKLRQEF